MPKSEEELQDEVASMLELSKSVENAEQAIMQLPEVASFFKRKKEAEAQIAAFWKQVEKEMVDNNIKSIKGDWGSVTVAEKLNWTVTNELPAKFYKKVLDTTKLSGTFKLEGKDPKGAFHSYSKYLVRRFK